MRGVAGKGGQSTGTPTVADTLKRAHTLQALQQVGMGDTSGRPRAEVEVGRARACWGARKHDRGPLEWDGSRGEGHSLSAELRLCPEGLVLKDT